LALAGGGIVGETGAARRGLVATGAALLAVFSERPGAAAATAAARPAASAAAPSTVNRRTRLTLENAASRFLWAAARSGPGLTPVVTTRTCPESISFA
jgi:hypothetical protein